MVIYTSHLSLFMFCSLCVPTINTIIHILACQNAICHMGRHIIKWAKLNFVARRFDPYVQGHKGHNGVRQNSTWSISLCGDPYEISTKK